MNQRSVAVVAFDGMEVLDYAGPYEVFNVAGELSGGAFSVVSFGVTSRPVGRGGFA
jgi:putative intracellular protease/amidase